MPRRVEDIRVTDRRSIRDVPLSEPKNPEPRTKGKSAGYAAPAKPAQEKEREIPIHRLRVTPPIHSRPPEKHSRGKSKGWIWLVTVILVVVAVSVAAYIASIRFSRATFHIVPVSEDISVDDTVVATSAASPNYLKYDSNKFSGQLSATVPASGGPYVSTKASGSVKVYNAYSKYPQRLIAGTRLANDSGLIYRLTGSITVPGYSTSGGSVVPGQTSAAIVADQAGAQYDIGQGDAISDFRIVAYKGSSKYDAFYARLSSDVTGGFVGRKKAIDPGTLASTTASLQAQIKANLLAEAKASVPAQSVMYDSAYSIVWDGPSISDTGTSSATVTESGSLYGLSFLRSDLVPKIAGADKVAVFGNFPYKAVGLDSLSFSIANPKDFSPGKGNTLIAHLKGDLKLEGDVPVAELAQKLAGLTLAETKNVITSYAPIIDVEKSTGELFPSWSSTVPTDLSRISVIVEGQ